MGEGTDGRVSTVDDVDDAFTDADGGGTENTLAITALDLLGLKAGNLSNLAGGGIHDIDGARVSSRHPDGVGGRVVGDVVHGNIACIVVWERQGADGVARALTGVV